MFHDYLVIYELHPFEINFPSFTILDSRKIPKHFFNPFQRKKILLKCSWQKKVCLKRRWSEEDNEENGNIDRDEEDE